MAVGPVSRFRMLSGIFSVILAIIPPAAAGV